MRSFRFPQLVASVMPLLMAAGCASGPDQDAHELGDRFQTQLRPQLAGGQAVLERLPEGVRVTVSEQSLFPRGSAELDDKGRYVLASVVESLLDPSLLQIQVVEWSPTSPALQLARVQAVADFLDRWQLLSAPEAPPVQRAVAGEVGTASTQATTIIVLVNPREHG